MNWRVLVTGSREWPDPGSVYAELDRELERMPAGSTLTVVHGDAPAGADRFAADWVEFRKAGAPSGGVTIVAEPHPADWDQFKKAAGPIRNQEMVDAGADFVLAFRLDGRKSRGTTDCMNKAWKAYIPIRALEERSRPDEGG